MGSFSRFYAIASTALVSLSLAAAPVNAATIAASTKPKLVTAADVQSVIDYIASKGASVTRGTDSDGKPQLTESNNYYTVYFYDCSDAKDQCQTLQLQACYAGYAQGNVTKTNEWTRNYVKVKAFIDASNNVCIAEPITTGKGGISYEAMDGSFDSFQWFTQHAPDQFK